MRVLIDIGLFSDKKMSFEIQKYADCINYISIHPRILEMIHMNIIHSDQIRVLNN